MDFGETIAISLRPRDDASNKAHGPDAELTRHVKRFSGWLSESIVARCIWKDSNPESILKSPSMLAAVVQGGTNRRCIANTINRASTCLSMAPSIPQRRSVEASPHTGLFSQQTAHDTTTITGDNSRVKLEDPIISGMVGHPEFTKVTKDSLY